MEGEPPISFAMECDLCVLGEASWCDNYARACGDLPDAALLAWAADRKPKLTACSLQLYYGFLACEVSADEGGARHCTLPSHAVVRLFINEIISQ